QLLSPLPLPSAISIPFSVSNIFSCSFLFHDPPPPQLYTLSLHDALPIFPRRPGSARRVQGARGQRDGSLLRYPQAGTSDGPTDQDRKSTRLNSSHLVISYAVFCLKKKKKKQK